MKNVFTLTLQSCKLQELPLHTEVVNLADIPEIICIKLPDSMPRMMELSGIYDLNSNKDIEFTDYVTRDEHRPWIDISTTILDLSSGQHIYKMIFSRLGVQLTATCWFSYIVQDNFVEKPYIYMTKARVESDIPKEDEDSQS